MTTQYTTLESPVGQIWVAWCADGLVSVGFVDQVKGAQIDRSWEYDRDLRCDAIDQLKAYFAGTLREFTLPLVLRGTDFQKRVWQQLATGTWRRKRARVVSCSSSSQAWLVNPSSWNDRKAGDPGALTPPCSCGEPTFQREREPVPQNSRLLADYAIKRRCRA